ncbi:Polyketide cyclase/dehydrase and lipid transport superfamily protein [Salix suchowensis]|nr:Polyketide cyclase/dehydrase and lipid transport superfamily protein [Salix suchowensis]
MALGSVLLEILQRPTVGEVLGEILIFVIPLWVAVAIGVIVGWAWRPKWASNLSGEMLLDSKVSKEAEKGEFSATTTSSVIPRKTDLVMEDDLEHLSKLLEVTDGGPAWIQVMDRSTPNMNYQAWRRDPETGPPQYRSRTVYEDVTPDLMRDFFWDDEFRAKWDDMLLHAETLEECPTKGTMVVHWVRKFPFFCSDREYIIGRRIWESDQMYYCVTKGIPCSSLPRRNKPRRVDLYYSSWCIRAVESKRRDGQLTACEVMLFHHEDMGIPWEIAKLGKIEAGLRAYQKHRDSAEPLSHSALMAQINTKVSADHLRSLESRTSDMLEIESQETPEKRAGNNIPKFLVIGGAIALACTLDRGLATKALIFGVARRFATGRRL